MRALYATTFVLAGFTLLLFQIASMLDDEVFGEYLSTAYRSLTPLALLFLTGGVLTDARFGILSKLLIVSLVMISGIWIYIYLPFIIMKDSLGALITGLIGLALVFCAVWTYFKTGPHCSDTGLPGSHITDSDTANPGRESDAGLRGESGSDLETRQNAGSEGHR